MIPRLGDGNRFLDTLMGGILRLENDSPSRGRKRLTHFHLLNETFLV